jgi:hypothetical protein
MMPEMHELVRLPVIPVQTPAPGGDPEITPVTLDYVIDLIIGKTLIIPDLVLINSEIVAVILIQPFPRSEPHEPPAVL